MRSTSLGDPPASPVKPGALGLRWRWLRRLLLAALLTCLLGRLLHRPLLRAFARAWVIEGQAGEADVIVMSTGVREHMFQQCLVWHRAGLAPRLVLTDAETRQTDRAGITEPMREVRLRQLRVAGLTEDAVAVIGHEISCLHEEFAALADWARTNHVRRVLLPTDPFATRRVQWLSERMLKPAGVEARVVPLDVPDYTVEEWWRKEAGLIAFENEWVLLPFYWARY